MEEENRVANYPRTGKKALPVGTSIIKWEEGKVELADSTTEYTTNPLEGRLCQAFLVYFDATVELGLYEENAESFYSSIFPTLYTRKRAYPFNTTRIKTDRETSFYIFAATDPEGIPTMELADYYEGNPFVERDSVAVAGTPVTINLFSELGTKAHTGTIQNLSAAADLYVELSTDGITFTDSAIVYPQQYIDIEDEDVHTTRLDASANATPYQVLAH